MSVQLIDIYHGNGVSSFHEVISSGVVGCIHKATQGVSEVDPAFLTNLTRSKEVGLYNGSYGYFDPAADPVLQANHLFETDAMGSGTLGHWLDVETLAGLSLGASVGEDARTSADRLKVLSGFYPGVYASDDFYQMYLKTYFPVGDFKLWIARYRTSPPDTPCVLWQYSESGAVPGISGNVDLDVFQGDLAAFKTSLVLP